MKVGPARDEQPQSPGDFQIAGHHCWGVVRIVDFKALQPGFHQRRDHLVFDAPSRVCQDGDPPRALDDLYRLGRAQFHALHVSRAVSAKVLLKRFFSAADHARLHEGPGHVWPAYRARGQRAHARKVDADPQRIELLHHFRRAVHAPVPQPAKKFLKPRLVMIDIVSQNMDFRLVYVGVDLYGWDDLHSHPAPGGHGRVDAIGAVVIGDGEDPHACVMGQCHQRLRRQQPIRRNRVRVQVNPHQVPPTP